MVITGKRKINKNFDPNEYLVKLLNDLENNLEINIDLANRVLMHEIEKGSQNIVVKLFNYLKKYKNETTFSLMIRYYSKTNLEEATKLLNMMDELNIKIKKRTIMPIFTKLVDNKDLDTIFILFKNRIKKLYEFEDEDYHSIINLLIKSDDLKKLNSFFKSMKRNLRTISPELYNIIKNQKSRINECKVDNNGICNGIQLKSVDLKSKEKNIILSNIENIYAKDKLKEITKYKKFLNKNKNINVLLDGANILFNTDRKITVNGYYRINTIYEYLKNNNMYPLIILHQRHKDYLNKSGISKNDLKYINLLYKNWDDNGDLYLTPYKMNDDWFFLYGSVYKQNCKVVTNDQLRDHIFKISEKEIHEDLLKKWIERRIVNYSFKYQDYQNEKTMKLKYPSKFSVRIQKIGDTWYFPESKKKWLTYKI